MTTIAPDLLITLLKERLAKSSDEDLAKELGIGKSTLASWRRRGSIPTKTVNKIINDFDLDPADIIVLSRGRSDLIQRQIEVAIGLALFRYARSLPEEDVLDAAVWAMTSYQDIRTFILSKFSMNQLIYANIEDFTKLVMLISRDEHATAEQLANLRAELTSDTHKVSHRFLTTAEET